MEVDTAVAPYPWMESKDVVNAKRARLGQQPRFERSFFAVPQRANPQVVDGILIVPLPSSLAHSSSAHMRVAYGDGVAYPRVFQAWESTLQSEPSLHSVKAERMRGYITASTKTWQGDETFVVHVWLLSSGACLAELTVLSEAGADDVWFSLFDRLTKSVRDVLGLSDATPSV